MLFDCYSVFQKTAKKLLEEKFSKKSESKFQLKNIFNAWTNHFSKIPSKQLGEQTRLHVDAERELWSVRKVVVHPLIIFKIIPPTVFCGLW